MVPPDSLAQVHTWVDFATHVFDKVWYVLGGLVPGFLAGWLAMNKPKFMQKGTPEDGDN